MRDVNKMLLTGRIVDEPEMRFTGEGEMFTTLVVSSAPARAQAEALHVRLVAWGESLAERCNNLAPGTRILAEGQLTSCTSEDADVRARFPLEVRLRDVIVINHGDTTPAVAPEQPPARSPAKPTPPRAAAMRPAVAPQPRPTAPGVPRRPTAPATPTAPTRAPRPMLEEVDLPL